jgi:predicted ATPase
LSHVYRGAGHLCAGAARDFAEIAAGAGYIDEISAIVDEMLERAERNQELWAFPEVLRLKGQLLLSQKGPDLDLVEKYFTHSLACAHAHGTLSWELRTAMSRARLRRDQGCIREARDLVSSVYGRFTEGFGTADLKAAKALIDDLQERAGARPDRSSL